MFIFNKVKKCKQGRGNQNFQIIESSFEKDFKPLWHDRRLPTGCLALNLFCKFPLSGKPDISAPIAYKVIIEKSRGFLSI